MSDRELLFGVLAWQVGFVSREDLRAVVQAGRGRRTLPLGQRLVDEKLLNPPRRSLVDRLVDERLTPNPDRPSSQADLPPEAGQLLAELHELVADDHGATLPERARTLAGMGASGAPREQPREAAAAPPARETRFRILRPHARGGLGEVFVARDEELNREVALKRIRNERLDTPENRARFLLEAEVTGGLEHPCIVPVYSLGVSEDGQPYYAMRLIRGHSLKEAIERFHHSEEAADESARLLELRQLLARLIEVCNAIGYAHSRGVLHRDLKPENIMLGTYGETLVVDWGLAKPLTPSGRATDVCVPHAQPESPERPDAACAEATMVSIGEGGNGTAPPMPFDPEATPIARAEPPASDSFWRPSASTAPTQMGSALGTPAYMSPEQASGRIDEIGPSSDVYSLGATLYCLLAGQAPFDGDSLPKMLERVRRGEFAPPRSIVRTVPAALEAVCLKAMARDPASRYDSPGALARDVERWLADEPVSAHAAPWQERLARWGRRHRRAVQIGAAALVVITTVSVGAALAVHAAKRQVMLEHGATRTALAAEQAAKNEARRAIDSFVNVVTEGEPPRDAHGRALRARLLSEALRYYEELISKYGDDEHLRHDLASAILRVGRINQQTGAGAEAMEAFREAQSLFKELAQRHPLESHYQSELAASYLGVAALHREMGRSREAVVQLRAAAGVLERLVKHDEADYRFQRQLATAYEQLAAVEQEMHEATGDQHAARASEIRKRLVERERPTPRPNSASDTKQ